jgi:hypothetical protein
VTSSRVAARTARRTGLGRRRSVPSVLCAPGQPAQLVELDHAEHSGDDHEQNRRLTDPREGRADADCRETAGQCTQGNPRGGERNGRRGLGAANY